MKCPHCGYLDGWDNETMKNIDGQEGDFYNPSNGIMVSRSCGFLEEEHKELHACPKCGKLFIEV